MIALCAQCNSPLTISDLGFNTCLNCHWQSLFDDPMEDGEGALRLALAQTVDQPDIARDSAGRIWQRFPGDAKTWCALCGEVIANGWMQGLEGGPQLYICDQHVEINFAPRFPR